jgi:hypothetical protein
VFTNQTPEEMQKIQGSERAVLSSPPSIMDMRVYLSWLSVILVATSAVAASNETGGPEPDQIYQTAFKEFKAAESDCQQAPTAQALTMRYRFRLKVS